MQIRPLAASGASFTPLALVRSGITDSFAASVAPTSAAPNLGQVLKPVSNNQVEQYRFQLPGQVQASPTVGLDGSLYCAHSEGLTILGPTGEPTGELRLREGSWNSPVVLSDGRALVCDQEGLHCVDQKGNQVFYHELGKPGATPVVGPEGRIFFPEHTGHLQCLDSGGHPLWTYETEPQRRDGGWPGHINGLDVGPDGTTLLNVQGALHIVTPDGKLERKMLGEKDGWGLAVGTAPRWASDGSILVSRATNRVECYERDGTQRWSTWLDKPGSDAQLGGQANTTPVEQDGLVVVGAAGGELSGIELATGKLVFQNDLSASMGNDRVQISSDGTIYTAGQYSSNAHAVNPQGERLWTFKFPARVERAFMASQGEKVFMVSSEGMVHALRSDTVQQQLAALPDDVEDPNRHGIAVSENAVIVGGVRVRRKTE